MKWDDVVMIAQLRCEVDPLNVKYVFLVKIPNLTVNKVFQVNTIHEIDRITTTTPAERQR